MMSITASSSSIPPFPSGGFSTWQPLYAAVNVPTFPVQIQGDRKVPMVKGYSHTGLRGSAELAQKFGHAEMLATMLGKQRFMLVDADTRSESVLADVLAKHGDSPIIVRTASKGGYHVYYGFTAHAWEHYGFKGRAVRPEPHKPVDYLAGGVAVLPPSRTPNGQYEFVRGNLSDLSKLPPFKGVVPPRRPLAALYGQPSPSGQTATTVARNNALWHACMRRAHGIANFDELLAFARATNAGFAPPMEESEVMKVAESAWGYTERGENWFAQHGAYFPIEEFTTFLLDQDAFFLLFFLRAHNGPWATFMCTNSLGEKFGWDIRRMRAARSRLIEIGYLMVVHQAVSGHPALYTWGEKVLPQFKVGGEQV
jgi:hypothetical protein